jgi:hypothetical protein
MRMKTLLVILLTCFFCTPAIAKSLTLCEFPWGPGVGVDRVSVFFDERVYDIEYFGIKQGDGVKFPSQRPLGGIQFSISLGLYSSKEGATTQAASVKKITFENLDTGEVYESNKALIYQFVSSWYASHNFYLGNSSKVKGYWEVVIHAVDGNKYKGHFTIDGTEVQYVAPIPVETVTVEKLDNFFKVSFPATNADYYNVRLLDGDNFIFNTRIYPNGNSELSCYIPASDLYDGKPGRIEARFYANKNPWPSLFGWSSGECSFKSKQYEVVRSSTYFLLKELD